MGEHRGRISQLGGNEPCFAVDRNIGVKSVDNQYVINVGDHTDANELNSIDQYQSKYVHVNRQWYNTECSVDKLGDVNAQVVEPELV